MLEAANNLHRAQSSSPSQGGANSSNGSNSRPDASVVQVSPPEHVSTEPPHGTSPAKDTSPKGTPTHTRMATEAADVEPAACARRAHQAESTCLPVSPSDLSLARCATPCTSPDNHITAETAATADEATTEEAAAEASPLLPSPPAEGGEGVGANSSRGGDMFVNKSQSSGQGHGQQTSTASPPPPLHHQHQHSSGTTGLLTSKPSESPYFRPSSLQNPAARFMFKGEAEHTLPVLHRPLIHVNKWGRAHTASVAPTTDSCS